MGRAQEVVEYRQKNPCLPGSAIARKFNLSRERVRQILFRAGENNVSNTFGLSLICPRCGGPKSNARKTSLCGNCWHETHTVPLICSDCGRLFTRRQSEVLYRVKRTGQNFVFCNKHCQGHYLGTHWARGPNPGRDPNKTPYTWFEKQKQLYRKSHS